MSPKQMNHGSGQILEKEVIFIAPDRKRIYTTIGYPSEKSKGIVLFIHGLASSELWPPMLLGSWYFRKRGYAYCRLNLYHWKKGARTLMTSDLKQHSQDVNTVVRRLKDRGFKAIYGVGHSFGGLTLLQTLTDRFSALSFWDCSSFIEHPPNSWFHSTPSLNSRYLIGSGSELLLSERFEQGMIQFPCELTLISNIKTPSQMCYAAGDGALLVESSKRYYKHLTSRKELVAIAGATHSFSEEGVANELFKRTEKWFRKFSS